MKRVCNICKIDKELSNFFKHKKSANGYGYTCKECNKIRTRIWQQNNKQKCVESSRQYREVNLEKSRLTNKRTNLRLLYNITPEEYNKILTQQNGVCAICFTKETVDRKGKKYDLCVDHCHETNTIRGLLCRKCNSGLGLLGDSLDTLKKAISYLEKHK